MWNCPRIGLIVGTSVTQSFDLRSGARLGSSPSLAQALEPHHGSRARLDLVLGDAHCRYLVMARPQGIRNRSELAAAMLSRFQATFGDSGDWQLRHQAAPRAQHDLVTGVEQGLLTDIEAQAEAARLHVVSIRPHWVAWARHLRRNTRRGNHWIVSSDGAWVSLGYLSQGECRQARSLRLPPGASLNDLLARERAFLDEIDLAATVWLGGHGIDTSEPLDGGATLELAEAAAFWGAAEAGT